MICLAKDLELFDNKIIILYILEKNSKALTIEQIAKFCEDFEDITYFDICSYIQELESNGYIDETYQESGDILYGITNSGLSTLHELLELIPGVNLHNIKKIINKNIVKIKTDYSIGNVVLPVKNDEFKVSCYIKDGSDELVNITMYAANKDQARNITKNWNNDAEEIYEKLLQMMTKEILEDE
ncbi:MAG: DUF4364 family protein [Clostridia bacterium]|nr:DUF4364 family protein [Clostridia bacterium]MBQ8379358.1 DUF4364 family protein [Clostridia bacterium]